VTTRHLLILVAPRLDGDAARLGVVASRKMGGSVQRNRAKRLVRESFRRNLSIFPARTDVVVIVRSGADELSQHELDTEIIGVASLLRKRAGGDGRPGRQERGPSKPRK
jgi:ribonuclease P protein component